MQLIKSLLTICLICLITLMTSCDEQARFEKIQEEIQQRLDEGESPTSILTSSRRIEKYDFVGLRYGGGVIYLYTPEQAQIYIGALEDISTAAPWGCKGEYLVETNAPCCCYTSQECTWNITSADCNVEGDAAELCINSTLEGYDDWLLPTLSEYQALINALATGGFDAPAGFHWTSTEYDRENAWASEFEIAEFSISGTDRGLEKDQMAAVRPVRIENL